MTGEPVVSIRCTVYNHEPYLRQCLDGFVMQQTTFPFEAIVHDDASTDGSATIIREYAEKFPDIIKPIYETVNQHSKHDGSIGRIMDAAIHPSAKYIALCEGDDYWTDPHKLQMQVDFLESHPEYTMCCNRTRVFSEKSESFTGEVAPINMSGTLSPEEIITRGGLFIATCSIVLRRDVMRYRPDFCRMCHVGDYPLQIMCAMMGMVYYFDRPMCVYRINRLGSWSTVQRGYDVERMIKARKSEVKMLEGFAKDYPQYRKVFFGRIAYYINLGIPIARGQDAVSRYLSDFQEYIRKYDWKWRLHLRMRFVHNRYIQYVYYKISNRLFLNDFS